MTVPGQAKRTNLPFLCFVLFSPQPIRWHPHWEGRSSLPIHSSANLFQRNTLTGEFRNNVYQWSGHPLAQSSWHIKLTITPRNCHFGFISIVLSLLECYIDGIIQYGSMMPLKPMQVSTCVSTFSFWLLGSIPLYGSTSVCLAINLLKGMWILPTFGLF